jgi:hypothetical protein
MHLALVGTVLFLFAPATSTVLPGNLETSYQSLQEAVANKDAAQVKKLAAQTYALAREAAEAPVPDGVEKAEWDKRIAYAHDVETYTEYALFTAALQGPAAETVDLIATLEQQNPKSKYLDRGYSNYLVALSQTGAAAKVPAIAEKALANFPKNEDLLLVLANEAMEHKQSERALGYAQRLLSALNSATKPQEVSAAAWEKKRSAELGRGHWIAGIVYCEKAQYVNADQELRASLPLIKGNNPMTGAALFNLGLANYQLGKMTMRKSQVQEAARFSEQAAGIPGPYAQQAWHNAQVMKTEADRMR